MYYVRTKKLSYIQKINFSHYGSPLVENYFDRLTPLFLRYIQNFAVAALFTLALLANKYIFLDIQTKIGDNSRNTSAGLQSIQ